MAKADAVEARISVPGCVVFTGNAGRGSGMFRSPPLDCQREIVDGMMQNYEPVHIVRVRITDLDKKGTIIWMSLQSGISA